MPEGAWHGEDGQGWVFIPPVRSMIVLRPAKAWSEETVRDAVEQLGRVNDADVLVLPADADVTVFPEDVMRKLGWRKCDLDEVSE